MTSTHLHLDSKTQMQKLLLMTKKEFEIAWRYANLHVSFKNKDDRGA